MVVPPALFPPEVDIAVLSTHAYIQVVGYLV